jgi:hypothetical protein
MTETSTPYDQAKPLSSQALIITISTQLVAAQLIAKSRCSDKEIIDKALNLTELLLGKINDGFSEPNYLRTSDR